jgi:hypothetical protein
MLPVVDSNNIVGNDPLFADAGNQNFSLLPFSPAIGNGLAVVNPEFDHAGKFFTSPRSIGAFEGSLATSITSQHNDFIMTVYPNPFHDVLNIYSEKSGRLMIFDVNGNKILSQTISNETTLLLHSKELTLSQGIYFVQIVTRDYSEVIKVILD